ncbi:RNA-binding S4 domain-containing protein [Azospirillum brasilense]|uniref:RNA-binding S4 domain-containing protein n=1 Tax=Azospirillum brasilense TaxID=192 RepID=A0A4D8R043_AZOBR|nr:RNA-binding S4 domain-containing protein [Azospirillum brasilense]QCO15271.1 RNA-binding S4 domain-containing protein [Azospirillum brasilense]
MTDIDDDDDLPDSGSDPTPAGRLRIDKWLWFARFFKTRSLAAKLCNGGGVRVSGTVVGKAHYAVKPGDVLTFAQGRHIRVIKVIALGSRRGPAPEAQALYEDLAPPVREEAIQDPYRAPPAPREPGAGRPTKRDRRALDQLYGEE